MPPKMKAEKEADSMPSKKEVKVEEESGPSSGKAAKVKVEEESGPSSGKAAKGAKAGGGKCSPKRVRILNEGTVEKGPVIYWYTLPPWVTNGLTSGTSKQ